MAKLWQVDELGTHPPCSWGSMWIEKVSFGIMFLVWGEVVCLILGVSLRFLKLIFFWVRVSLIYIYICL